MHALAILTDLPRINEWPFTTGRDAPVTYATVRNTFAKAASTAGLVDVRLHDLRRTVMPRAAMAGVGTHVLRDLLGHRTTAMADRYIRSVGNPVRDARELVGAAMTAMMQGEPGSEVVQTPRGQRHAPDRPPDVHCTRPVDTPAASRRRHSVRVSIPRCGTQCPRRRGSGG